MIKTQIEKDIWDWIINFIEVNHKFYNYKFPPCPYAKAARLKGLVSVSAYEKGSIISFIRNESNNLITNKQYSTLVLVFPNYTKWIFYLKWWIARLNKKIIADNYYVQYGTAIKTVSKYSGIGNSKPYFIVIFNKLDDVIAGHKSLLKTDYYTPWDDFHYKDIVDRRQQAFDKYKRNDK